jgi:hypothetical protein
MAAAELKLLLDRIEAAREIDRAAVNRLIRWARKEQMRIATAERMGRERAIFELKDMLPKVARSKLGDGKRYCTETLTDACQRIERLNDLGPVSRKRPLAWGGFRENR